MIDPLMGSEVVINKCLLLFWRYLYFRRCHHLFNIFLFHWHVNMYISLTHNFPQCMLLPCRQVQDRIDIELILCLLCYYCIVNTRIIIAFINSSLYSYEMYTQVKEMVILHLFIEHHYKYIVLSIRERHVLTLHLSTAN